MSLEAFVLSLFENGQIELPDVAPLTSEDLAAATAALQSFEKDYRLSVPGDPPTLDIDGALWGATSVYRASQLLLFRDHDANTVDQLLGVSCNTKDGASAHYSVDLVMRFLPDLVRLAQSITQEDPLVTHLMTWAADWPLSSVGVEGVQVGDRIRDVVSHPSLLKLYADRIIEHKDFSRVANTQVADAVSQAIGLHRELAPEICNARESEGNDRGR